MPVRPKREARVPLQLSEVRTYPASVPAAQSRVHLVKRVFTFFNAWAVNLLLGTVYMISTPGEFAWI